MKIVLVNAAKRFALGVMPREGLSDEEVWNRAWTVAKAKSIGTTLKDGTQGRAASVESYVYPQEAPKMEGVETGDWLIGAVYDDRSFAEMAKGENVMRNVSKREQPLNEGRGFWSSAVFEEDAQAPGGGGTLRTQSEVDAAFNRWGVDESNRHLVEEPGLVRGARGDNWLRAGDAYIGGVSRPNVDDAFPLDGGKPYALLADGGEPRDGMFGPSRDGVSESMRYLSPEAHGLVVPAGFRPVFKARERIERGGRGFRVSFANLLS